MVVLLDCFNHLRVYHLLLGFSFFELSDLSLKEFDLLSEQRFFRIPFIFFFSDLFLKVILHLLNDLLHIVLSRVALVELTI